uniref:Uncharacterized protein n=1 Tax=Rhizophora mucronata TaxID=61149 RepID=A0A2P2N6H2_RHIMU
MIPHKKIEMKRHTKEHTVGDLILQIFNQNCGNKER